MEAVCATDNTLICWKCGLFEEHKGHDIVEIDKVQKQIRDRAEKYDSINRRLCDAVTALESKEKSILEGEMVKNMQEMISKNKKTAQDSINKAFKQYSAEIEKKRADIMSELDSVY